MTIRLATVYDAQSIHDLHTLSVRKLCAKSYSSEIIDGWLKGRTPEGYRGIHDNAMYLLEDNCRIVGFSHVVPGEIVAIFIHPDFTRKGYGSQLVRHALGIAKKDWEGTIKIDSTLNAEPFYRSLGFRKIGETDVKRNNILIRVINMQYIP